MEAVIEGFRRTYAALSPHSIDVSRRALALGVKGRVLLRPTQMYNDALNAAYHPAASIDSTTNLNVLTQQLADSSGIAAMQSVGSSTVCAIEATDLFRMRIPAYTAAVDDESIVIGDVKLTLDSALAAIDRRARLSHDSRSVDRLSDEIRKAIVAYNLSVRLRHGKVHERTRRRRPLNSTVEDAISITTTDLIRLAQPGSPATWISVFGPESTGWRAALGGYDLYSGSAGVMLGILAGSKIVPSRAADQFTCDLFEQLSDVDWLRSLPASVPGGGFAGTSGIAFALAAACQIAGYKKDRARVAIRCIAEMNLTKREGAESFDVIAGLAGEILAFSELARAGFLSASIAGRACLSAIESLERLRDTDSDPEMPHWEDSTIGTWLGGVSHGAGGVAWAAGRYARLGLDGASRAAALATAAERTQQSLRLTGAAMPLWRDRRPAEMIGDSPMDAWCHGAVGLQLVSSEPEGELSRLAENLYSYQFLKDDHSLCHGVGGRVIAALECLRGRGANALAESERVEQDIAELITWLVEPIDPISPARDHGAEGLMVGRAGAIWALSRHRLRSLDIEPLMLRLA